MIFNALLCVLLSAPSLFASSAEEKWKQKDPGDWANLDPKYATCKTGQFQSPINFETVPGKTPIFQTLSGPVDVSQWRDLDSEPTVFKYDGYTLDLGPFNSSGNAVVTRFRGEPYRLSQIHFHARSEHTIKGQHAAMEMHMVHRNANGSLAVIGVLFNTPSPSCDGTNDSRFLDMLASYIPGIKDADTQTNVIVPLKTIVDQEFLGFEDEIYNYYGSLTIPPCTEGVDWYVSTKIFSVRPETLDMFQSVMRYNSRPVQRSEKEASKSGAAVLMSTLSLTSVLALATFFL